MDLSNSSALGVKRNHFKVLTFILYQNIFAGDACYQAFALRKSREKMRTPGKTKNTKKLTCQQQYLSIKLNYKPHFRCF